MMGLPSQTMHAEGPDSARCRSPLFSLKCLNGAQPPVRSNFIGMGAQHGTGSKGHPAAGGTWPASCHAWCASRRGASSRIWPITAPLCSKRQGDRSIPFRQPGSRARFAVRGRCTVSHADAGVVEAATRVCYLLMSYVFCVQKSLKCSKRLFPRCLSPFLAASTDGDNKTGHGLCQI